MSRLSPGMRELMVDGHRMGVLALNPGADGEPIFLMHGINLTPQLWLTDELFVRHGPCYSLTLPGHAPARFPRGFRSRDLTPELIARLLSRTIRAIVGDRPVTLAGISTGGFAALAVAAYDPALVRRVVCISGFVRGRWTGPLEVSQRLARLGPPGWALVRLMFVHSMRSPTAFRDEIWPRYVAERASLYAYPRLDELIGHLYRSCCWVDLGQLRHYYLMMPQTDISQLLPRIAAPTLVVAGSVDGIVPPAQSPLIAGAVPGAELVMVPGASHLLFIERPAEYQQVIGGWLRRTA